MAVLASRWRSQGPRAWSGVPLLFSVFSLIPFELGHVNVLSHQINKDNSKFKKNLKNI